MTNDRDKTIIVKLTTLLDNDWEKSGKIIAFLASCYNNDTGSKVETKIDPLYILSIAIYNANIGDDNEFISSTQLNIKKVETYE